MKYESVAPLFGLYSFAQAYDIQALGIHRSRLPIETFRALMKNLRIADCHVGGVSEHDTEAARCSYLDALFGSIAAIFQKHIINRPDHKLVSEVASRGQVKYQYLALNSVITVFIEVRHQVESGIGGLNQLAQVMAEGDGEYFKPDISGIKLINIIACDVFNDSRDMWVPMRGILTDGEKFIFVEYQSDTRTWFKSDIIRGIDVTSCNDTEFAISVKKRILRSSLTFKR